MSKLSDLGGDLSRLSEIAQIMNKHGFAPSMHRLSWSLKKSAHQQNEKEKKTQAERFTLMLEELGPTFIKLGQLLSTRGDLLPSDFITALSRLQDNAPCVSFAEIKNQIEFSLKKQLSEIFVFIEEKPLASASIAQVHSARLHDGSEVVVKVLKPDIKTQIERDSSMILMVARLLEWLIEEASEYQTVDLAGEFLNALSDEINFLVEANNLQMFAASNQKRPLVKVPKLYLNLCSAEVLVMEKIEGKRITELQYKNDKKGNAKIIEYLLDIAFEHLFIDGLFHGDPHPGNILITPDNKIAFIDFGLLGHVARDHQDRLLSILLALSFRDPDTLSRQLIHLGEPTDRVSIHRFRNSIRHLLDNYAGLNIGNIQAGNIMNDILEVSLQYKIHLPKEFALLTKATLTIEGIIRSLHSEIHVVEHLSKKAEALLIDRLDPRNFRSAGAKTALQLATLAQDLPAQINQTLVDLERGEVQISILSKDLAKLNRTLRSMAIAICSGLFSIALFLCGFYCSLQNKPTETWLTYVLFASSAFLFFLIILWSFIGKHSFPKLSIHRWTKKDKLRKRFK